MANQSLVRHVNERRLLGALRIAGPLSRAELARRLSLTRASVTGMVDDLFARGFVVEDAAALADGRRDAGRPGIALRLAPGGAYFLGVEIGVGIIRLALIDLTGRPVETESHAVAADIAPEAVIGLLRSRVAAFRAHPAYGPRLSGIGVTVPGLVSRTGHVVNLPILGWRDVPFGAALTAALALPVFVENNANAAAFGHIYADPGAGEGVLVYLKIGTGCGGAVVIDNKLMRGSHGLGAEIGHLRVAPDGPPCKCGQRGCLETFVNLKALQRYATDFGLTLEGTDAPAALRERLSSHQLYSRLTTPRNIAIFMKHHVWAVWDFMSLVKALQRQLTCVELPWRPVGDPEIRYLINDIVVGEESDLDRHGRRTSHFEMYLEAMKGIGATTTRIEHFIALLGEGTPVDRALYLAGAPEASARFVRHTFEVIGRGKIHEIASLFTYGREDVIPTMFIGMLDRLEVPDGV